MSSYMIRVLGRRTSIFMRQNVRAFSTPVEAPKPSSESSKLHSSSKATHKVNGLERKMLVWTGKFKSADEVPSYVKLVY